MRRRVVDASKVAGLVAQSKNQEVVKGTPRTYDPKFPLMTTPINQKVLVYIPRTNVVQDESGETMQLLHSHQHALLSGRSFSNVRCINGLTGNPLFDELGYDGTCPACDAVVESWELYNLKLDAEIARQGLDKNADNKEILKPFREVALRERAVKESEEFVAFPVVIVPADGFKLKDDSVEGSKAVFVQWRKDRYEKLIGKALEAVPSAPAHAGGMFFMWDFTYDTKGKEAKAMDSARELKVTAITDSGTLDSYSAVRTNAEKIAEEFTVNKAAEVIVASAFMYREDLVKEIDRTMVSTRETIALAKTQGGSLTASPQLTAPAGSGNPLLAFGADTSNTNLGEATPQPEQQPVAVGLTPPPANFSN